MALSAAQMQEAVIKNLPEKTGKPLEEWIAIARHLNASKKSDLLNQLKSVYGLGHIQAQTIVWRMEGERPYIDTNGYEEAIFKNTLPLYKKVKSLIMAISDEINVKPCKTYIPFYRKNQFAILTEKKGALILGLHLKKHDFPELQHAEKLGGSERINKMMVVNKTNLNTIKPYIQKAFDYN